jgi:hypothetical protein
VSALLVGLILGQLLGNGNAGGAGAGAAPAGPAAPEAIIFTVNDRTETRVRSSIRATGPRLGDGTTAVDVDNALLAGLLFTGRHKSLLFAYGPRLSYLDIEGDRQLSLMHTGRAVGSYWTRRLRLTLTLDGSIGSQSAIAGLTPVNFDAAASPAPAPAAGPAATPTAPVPPVQPTPVATPVYLPLTALLVLTTATGRAAVGASYLFSRHVSGIASVSYVATGGLDYNSQVIAPPSRGPGADAALTYTLNRRDALATIASTSYITVLSTPRPMALTPPDRSYLLVTALESYRHAWSRRTTSSVGVGMTYLGASNDPNANNAGVSAAGDATISHVEPIGHTTRVEYRGSAQLGLVYNPVLGRAQQQASALASYAWTHEQWTLSASAGAATTLPWNAVDAARTVSGTAAVAWQPSRVVQLQTGVRGYAQVFPPTNAAFQAVGAQAPINTPPQWVAFAAVTVFAPPIAF